MAIQTRRRAGAAISLAPRLCLLYSIVAASLCFAPEQPAQRRTPEERLRAATMSWREPIPPDEEPESQYNISGAKRIMSAEFPEIDLAEIEKTDFRVDERPENPRGREFDYRTRSFLQNEAEKIHQYMNGCPFFFSLAQITFGQPTMFNDTALSIVNRIDRRLYKELENNVLLSDFIDKEGVQSDITSHLELDRGIVFKTSESEGDLEAAPSSKYEIWLRAEVRKKSEDSISVKLRIHPTFDPKLAKYYTTWKYTGEFTWDSFVSETFIFNDEYYWKNARACAVVTRSFDSKDKLWIFQSETTIQSKKIMIDLRPMFKYKWISTRRKASMEENGDMNPPESSDDRFEARVSSYDSAKKLRNQYLRLELKVPMEHNPDLLPTYYGSELSHMIGNDRWYHEIRRQEFYTAERLKFTWSGAFVREAPGVEFGTWPRNTDLFGYGCLSIHENVMLLGPATLRSKRGHIFWKIDQKRWAAYAAFYDTKLHKKSRQHGASKYFEYTSDIEEVDEMLLKAWVKLALDPRPAGNEISRCSAISKAKAESLEEFWKGNVKIQKSPTEKPGEYCLQGDIRNIGYSAFFTYGPTAILALSLAFLIHSMLKARPQVKRSRGSRGSVAAAAIF